MRIFAIAAIVLASCSAVAFAQDAILLEQAVKDRKVAVVITGTGGSTGDAIVIYVQRKVADILCLTLTPGIVFKSTTGRVQNMVGASIKGERVDERSYRATSEILLKDDDKHCYVVEAYCLDFHKANPGSHDSFVIATHDPRAETF